ncbi:GntR family transcriptional regulator [Gilvimarinus xylanilyticus]|uniref:GntR family transcriptional regulator n=1 Tax=Gilvimarinus xylanilyticus TaxID=2944139 RepID=A0A9X2HXN9_9GAMM|nr:GntR family transcriptional regulator [Gilvimarinus xylanilyticus]MCP8898456.1 GntR family transcriptional regulator [Gilvimarinus xylanilyticus]
MSKLPLKFLDKAAEYSRQIDYDRPASGQIYAFIRDAIVAMELEPGQLISEAALAAKFGVSRTPVREALIKLANLGFVNVLPQRGTYVSRLSLEKIIEARFIREALEVSVVSHLAENVNKDVIKAAENIIAEQKAAAEVDDALLFQRLDDDFHQLLASYTGYQRMASMIEQEKAHMDRVRNLSLHISGQYKCVLAQHRAIIRAIKSGSVSGAASAMSTHLREVYKVLETLPKEHPEYFQ